MKTTSSSDETEIIKPKAKKGFATLTPDLRREIARKGGRASYRTSPHSYFTTETAGAAGVKGGTARGKLYAENKISRVADKIVSVVNPTTGAICSIGVLTNRERLILELLVKDFTSLQIAEKLNMKAGAVNVHICNLCKKLKTANRTEAINMALEYNITLIASC